MDLKGIGWPPDSQLSAVAIFVQLARNCGAPSVVGQPLARNCGHPRLLLVQSFNTWRMRLRCARAARPPLGAVLQYVEDAPHRAQVVRPFAIRFADCARFCSHTRAHSCSQLLTVLQSLSLGFVRIGALLECVEVRLSHVAQAVRPRGLCAVARRRSRWTLKESVGHLIAS